MKSFLLIVVVCLIQGLAVGCSRSQPEPVTQSSSANPVTPVKTAPAEAAVKTTESTNPAASPATNTTNESKSVNTNPASNTNEVAIIKTTAGDMVVEFWPDVAPKTVENFKTLAKKGFYDGTAFHRIIKGFMIQGGDPLSKQDDPRVGTGGPGYSIKAEFNNRSHQRGVLSMARSSDPDSAGSQFFICLGDASFLDRQYTAFGKLIKGDDVLGKIGDTPVGGAGGEKSKPLTRVGVESIKIVPADSVK